MKTIETMITVLADGQIQIPPRPDLAPGEHRAVLLVDEANSNGTVETRAQVASALAAARLLAELTSDEQTQASHVTLTLDEARAILNRSGGKPLSDVILDLRGPKP
jgi:hypothetical protein